MISRAQLDKGKGSIDRLGGRGRPNCQPYARPETSQKPNVDTREVPSFVMRSSVAVAMADAVGPISKSIMRCVSSTQPGTMHAWYLHSAMSRGECAWRTKPCS